MKIGGFGELESLRKALQKEEPRKTPARGQSSAGAAVPRSDEVQISPKAKLFGKLSQVPDIREAKVEEIRQKMEDGTLFSPEAMRSAIRNLLLQL